MQKGGIQIGLIFKIILIIINTSYCWDSFPRVTENMMLEE